MSLIKNELSLLYIDAVSELEYNDFSYWIHQVFMKFIYSDYTIIENDKNLHKM